MKSFISLGKNFSGCVVTAIALSIIPLKSHAQVFPAKTVTIVNPYAVGGPADQLVRILAKGMSEQLGQPVIVENKVGAGGVLATQFVAQSAPDGYTLLLGSNIQLVQKIMKPDLSINPLIDFVPISNMYSSPLG